MEHVLSIFHPDRPVDRIAMSGVRMTLGRDESNDLHFPGNLHLSRHHLVFLKRGDSWFVRHVGTKNRTLINGIPTTAERSLTAGDLITAGDLLIRFDTAVADPVQAETTLHEALTQCSSEGDPAVLGLLVRVCRELMRSVTPECYGFVLSAAMERLRADRGVLLILEGEKLIASAKCGPDFPVSDTVTDRVIRERRSLVVHDVELDTQLNQPESLILQNVRSLIAVPLQTEDRVHGLIYMDKLRRHSFTLEDLNLVTVLAHIAAIRREQEVLQARERAQREETSRMELLAEARRRALEVAETMRHAEARAVLAETAASMGRLAAAVSHELNTPLGALKSSAETLARVVERFRSADGLARAAALIEELSGSIVRSAERLGDIVLRLQRITNLDRADVQQINLPDLLSDVVQMVSSDGVQKVVLDLPPLPTVLSKPQSLSVVFSSLLHHCRANEVRVTAGFSADSLQVRFEQPGIGMPESALVELFDPSFRVIGGTVRTDNWGLFSARQLMRELGGDISADSNQCDGTVFVVLIPRERHEEQTVRDDRS